MNENITSIENQLVLDKAGKWFFEVVIKNHILNTEKLEKSEEFNLNPLLNPYLSAFLTGSVTPEGIARALIYPRVLGTSINTSFGQNIQNFISEVLVDAYGSLAQGVDIVFKDKLDGQQKYAQLKLGPNTINKDDVATIHGHFNAVRNLAKVNNVKLNSESMIIGVMYGTDDQLSSHYKKLRDTHYYPTFVGKDFWVRLTGDEFFFNKLVQTIANNISTVNSSKLIEDTILKLSRHKAVISLAQLASKD